MSLGKIIPYDTLYKEWLHKKCVLKMPIYKLATEAFTIRVTSDLFFHPFQFLSVDAMFFCVCFSKPRYHIAVLLYRKLHPVTEEPTFEYIDSMADLNNDAQSMFEIAISNACKRQSLKYLGSVNMYNGYRRDKETNRNEYCWEPPQNIENMLVNNTARLKYDKYRASIKPYRTVSMRDEGQAKRYVESLQKFEGGDCMHWSHLIAGEMMQNDSSSWQWMQSFRDAYIQAPEVVAMYSAQRIFQSLGKCVLKKSTFRKPVKTCIPPLEFLLKVDDSDDICKYKRDYPNIA